MVDRLAAPVRLLPRAKQSRPQGRAASPCSRRLRCAAACLSPQTAQCLSGWSWQHRVSPLRLQRCHHLCLEYQRAATAQVQQCITGRRLGQVPPLLTAVMLVTRHPLQRQSLAQQASPDPCSCTQRQARLCRQHVLPQVLHTLAQDSGLQLAYKRRRLAVTTQQGCRPAHLAVGAAPARASKPLRACTQCLAAS